MPATVWSTDDWGRHFMEHTVVEYCTPLEVVFASAMPFQEGDHMRLSLRDCGLDIAMHVVAIRAGHDKSAVAARVTDKAATLPVRRMPQPENEPKK